MIRGGALKTEEGEIDWQMIVVAKKITHLNKLIVLK